MSAWPAVERLSSIGATRTCNTTLAVARILGDGRRKRTRVFSELQSHYLFSDRFGRPGTTSGRTGRLCPAELHGAGAKVSKLGSVQRAARCLNNRTALAAAHRNDCHVTAKRDRQALLPLPPMTPHTGYRQGAACKGSMLTVAPGVTTDRHAPRFLGSGTRQARVRAGIAITGGLPIQSTLPRRCAKPASWERLAWMQSGT